MARPVAIVDAQGRYLGGLALAVGGGLRDCAGEGALVRVRAGEQADAPQAGLLGAVAQERAEALRDVEYLEWGASGDHRCHGIGS